MQWGKGAEGGGGCVCEQGTEGAKGVWGWVWEGCGDGAELLRELLLSCEMW